ncbi:hypothetical protein LSPH24S_06529 [Lysinibacillus sphaericus]
MHELLPVTVVKLNRLIKWRVISQLLKSFDWEQLKVEGTLQASDVLRAKVAQDATDSGLLWQWCSTASPLYAVLADEGYENIQLYTGSYSDWITAYDVETGTNE